MVLDWPQQTLVISVQAVQAHISETSKTKDYTCHITGLILIGSMIIGSQDTINHNVNKPIKPKRELDGLIALYQE